MTFNCLSVALTSVPDAFNSDQWWGGDGVKAIRQTNMVYNLFYVKLKPGE